MNREEQDAHILRGVALVCNAPVANRSKGIGDTIVQWCYRCTCRILNCVSVPLSKQELAVCHNTEFVIRSKMHPMFCAEVKNLEPPILPSTRDSRMRPPPTHSTPRKYWADGVEPSARLLPRRSGEQCHLKILWHSALSCAIRGRVCVIVRFTSATRYGQDGVVR